MRTGSFLLVVATMVVGMAFAARAQSSALKVVMRQKTEDAERLLEPVVNADFSQIERYSERLSRISMAEISSWHARPEPLYSQRASAFLKAVLALRRAAADHKADEAVSSYTALIASCADCHAFVRRTRPISDDLGRRREQH